MRHHLAATALVALLGTACASSGHTVSSESGGEVSPSAPVTVRVKSEYIGPIAIYAVAGGMSTRLGDVQGTRVETFRVPFSTIPTDGVAILAVPVGGYGRASTGTLLVQPGSTVDFTVGATLTNSSVQVKSP